MSFNIQKRYVFSRRVFVTILFQGIMFLIIIVRLAFLQIFSYKKYREIARLNGLKINFIMPKRGAILDRNNNIIANSIKTKFILFDGLILTKKDHPTIKRVYDIIYNESPNKAKRAFNKAIRMAQNNPYDYLILYRNLDVDTLTKISFYLPTLKHIVIKDGYVRYYNFSESLSHVVGYVISATNHMIENAENSLTKKLYRYTNYFMGAFGIELKQEEWLAGKYGVSSVNADIKGNVVKQDLISQPVPGNDVKIAIDSRVQLKMHKLFTKNHGGGAILLDIKSGDILGMHSAPSFDPNAFLQENISEELVHKLYFDETRPFFNRCISGLYSPGSIFKVISALSAINHGFDPNTKIKCKGEMKIGNRDYHCWKKEGHGTIENTSIAIAKSCNVYFYNIAKYLEIDDLYYDAVNLGYDISYDIGIGKTIKGNIPNREWKMNNKNEGWFMGDTINTAIGQGYVQTSLMQMVISIAKIASGKNIYPNLWKDFHRNNDLDINPNYNKINSDFSLLDGISPKAMDVIKHGLYSVVNEKFGSLYNLGAVFRNLKICGKTGTAQVVSYRIDAKDMRENNKNASHGLFVGYAPFDNPKYAIATIVEKGIWGSVSAFPIAARILEFAIKNDV